MLCKVKTLFLIIILIFLSSHTKADSFPKITDIARYDQGPAFFNLDRTGFIGSLSLSENYDPLDVNISHYVLKNDSECGTFAVSLIQGHVSLDDPEIKRIEEQSKNGNLEAGCKMVFIESKRYNFQSFISYLKKVSRQKHPLIMSLHANHYLNNFSVQGRTNGKEWVLKESESLLKQACDLKSVYACSQLFAYYYSINKKDKGKYKNEMKNTLANAKKEKMIYPFVYAAYLYGLNSNEEDQKLSQRILNYLFKKDSNLIEIINLISLYKLTYFAKNPLLKPLALKDLKFWADKAVEQSFYGAEYFQSLYELHLGEDIDKALDLLRKSAENQYYRAKIDYLSHAIINQLATNEELLEQVKEVYLKEPRALFSILTKIKNHLKNQIVSFTILTQQKDESEQTEMKQKLEDLSDTYEFWMKKGAKLRDFESLKALAYFYFTKKEYEKSMKIFQFIESKNKQSPRDTFTLAFLYSLQKDEEQTKNRLKKCTKSIYPPCIMQYLSLYQDEVDKKEREYLLSVAAILGDKEAFFPLSISFSKIQDKENAISWFQEASKHQPNLIHEAYYLVLLNLGEKDRALELLDQIKKFLVEQQEKGSDNSNEIEEIEDKIQKIRDGVN